MHNGSQWPNLRNAQLSERLGGGEGAAESLLEAISFKKTTEGVGLWVEEESRMPDGSEFHTAWAATLKPREAKVVRTRGTNNRLVLAEHTERVEVR